MYYTVYQITNKINGKIYVGCHQTIELDDGYYGSGKIILRAVEKYGIESFEKEILHVFETSEEMFQKEAEIVNEDFIARDDTYNLKVGGTGGWDFVNNLPKNEKQLKASRAQGFITRPSEKGRKTLSKASALRWQNDDFRSKMENVAKTSFRGKRHSEEAKKKIGDANSRHQSGKGNSQYGTCWVYSLEQKQSIRIPKDALNDYIADGWMKGRKIKF